MIREERNPAFWIEVGSHPAVARSLYGLTPQGLAMLALRDSVVPLATTHGGFLFSRVDACGLVYDLHAAFMPEGWGREVHDGLLAALTWVFGLGAQVVFNYETDNRNSRPPRSFGFRLAGGETDTQLGPVRAWVLTQTAWEASPAFHRRVSCLHS